MQRCVIPDGSHCIPTGPQSAINLSTHMRSTVLPCTSECTARLGMGCMWGEMQPRTRREVVPTHGHWRLAFLRPRIGAWRLLGARRASTS